MSTDGHVPVYVTEDERDSNVAMHKIKKTSMRRKFCAVQGALSEYRRARTCVRN